MLQKSANKRKIIALVFSFYCLLSIFPIFTYAEGTGVIDIITKYSDGIGIDSNDEFILTIQNEDTGESTTINIIPEENDGFQQITVPAGIYLVTSLAYNGNNDAVVEQGYGTEGKIRVYEEDGGVFHIYVGSSLLQGLDNDYGDNAYIKDDQHDENGKRVVFEDENGLYQYVIDENGETKIEYVEEFETSENDESSEISSTDANDTSAEFADEIPTQTPGSQDYVTEYYDIEDTTSDNSNFSWSNVIVVVLILALILGVALFYLRKKKII